METKDEEKTAADVAFRVYPDGEVVAIMPEFLGTRSPYTCMLYAHVGQHGVCHDPWALVSSTKKATPEQYADLKRELERIGYIVRVVERINTQAYLRARKAQVKE